MSVSDVTNILILSRASFLVTLKIPMQRKLPHCKRDVIFTVNGTSFMNAHRTKCPVLSMNYKNDLTRLSSAPLFCGRGELELNTTRDITTSEISNSF